MPSGPAALGRGPEPAGQKACPAPHSLTADASLLLLPATHGKLKSPTPRRSVGAGAEGDTGCLPLLPCQPAAALKSPARPANLTDGVGDLTSLMLPIAAAAVGGLRSPAPRSSHAADFPCESDPSQVGTFQLSTLLGTEFVATPLPDPAVAQVQPPSSMATNLMHENIFKRVFS